MEILGYLAAVIMGMVLGLVGGGGSILTVPILVYLFALPPALATGYSLFIVGTTALLGSYQYARGQLVDFRTGVMFAVPSFLGVYLARAFVVPKLPDSLFSLGHFEVTKSALIMLVFAILMVLASVSMIRSKKASPAKEPQTKGLDFVPHSPAAFKKSVLIVLEGLIVGGITGFVGAGGGFLIIPALVILVGLPMKTAVGTSLAIIAVKSLLGFLGDLQTQPEIDFIFLLMISSMSLIGMTLGLKLKSRFSEESLKKSFGYFVLVMGFVILGDQLF